MNALYGIVVLLIRAAIIFGCAYLVFWKDAHGAWFFVAIILCAILPLSSDEFFRTRISSPKSSKGSSSP